MSHFSEENSSLNVFFNKDIEMSYSLCLNSLFSKISLVVVFRSPPSSRNVFFLHYHENLSLEVVLRVRNCTHVALSLDIQMSRLQ